MAEHWSTSSYSLDNGNCLEWKTASHTGLTCVEVAVGARAYVRDTKDRTGPVLAFTGSAWDSFIGWVST